MTKSIFQLIGLLLGKDIDSFINEALDDATFGYLCFTKRQHLKYLKIIKKRKFKHKI